jgi:RimJ/RimL family protein N-acetyltransferase
LKETGELIGSGGLSFREDRGVYELAYNLMKKYWNHGLATEASQAIIDFGKTTLRQTAFFGCHVKENPASGMVLTKVGFHYARDGEYYCDNWERNLETKEYILEVDDKG